MGYIMKEQKAIGYYFVVVNSYEILCQLIIAMEHTRILYIQGTVYNQFWYKDNWQKQILVFVFFCVSVRTDSVPG